MPAKSLIKSSATPTTFDAPPAKWMRKVALKIAMRYGIPSHQVGIVARMIAEHQPAQSATERAEMAERREESEYSHSDGAHRD